MHPTTGSQVATSYQWHSGSQSCRSGDNNAARPTVYVTWHHAEAFSVDTPDRGVAPARRSQPCWHSLQWDVHSALSFRASWALLRFRAGLAPAITR